MNMIVLAILILALAAGSEGQAATSAAKTTMKGITSATTSRSEKVIFEFDPSTNAFGVEIGGSCYVSKLIPGVVSELHNPQYLANLELHFVELVTIHSGQHRELTLLDLVHLSGTIANHCAAATKYYEIYDPHHSLWVIEAPTGTTSSAIKSGDCYDILHNEGKTTSGEYTIYPTGVPNGVVVYCDMTTDGGGWLVFQRRKDGTQDFYKDWAAYTTGFGDVTKEFWLGNSALNLITSMGRYELRIDMESFLGESRFARYDTFSIENQGASFRLHVSGYSGTAGDAMTNSNNMRFGTQDRDNDLSSNNCAREYKSGGWWFNACFHCDLNGAYSQHENIPYSAGIIWFEWQGYSKALRKTEMKIRPLH